jgi:hypothetical protein
MVRRIRWAVALAWLAAPLAMAQVSPEAVRITDPERLRQLGFPSHADNVFELRPVADREPAPASLEIQAPDTWGGAVGYTTIPGFLLQEESGFYTYLDRLPTYTHCTSGLEGNVTYPTFASAPIEVPEGAMLSTLRYWAYDTSSSNDLYFRVYSVCQGFSSGAGPTITMLGEGFTIAAVGQYNAFAGLGDVTVDNRNCHYFVQVEFAPPDVECSGHALRVQKLQVAWIRQVSPAPAVASFNDVPTTHPYFRFIEALKDSGITGGCSVTPPMFCPNNPITRGEMAVFLAAALGLSWP